MSSVSREQPGSATPLRDELGLNVGGDDSAAILNEKRKLKQQKAMLKEGLTGLPEPQYAYEVEIPDVSSYYRKRPFSV